jgi:hypothetical protein
MRSKISASKMQAVAVVDNTDEKESRLEYEREEEIS